MKIEHGNTTQVESAQETHRIVCANVTGGEGWKRPLSVEQSDIVFMQETRFKHKFQPRGEAYQLGWELLDQGPTSQEGGITLVITARRIGPGWARALDPQVPSHYQGRISHTLVGTGGGSHTTGSISMAKAEIRGSARSCWHWRWNALNHWVRPRSLSEGISISLWRATIWSRDWTGRGGQTS